MKIFFGCQGEKLFIFQKRGIIYFSPEKYALIYSRDELIYFQTRGGRTNKSYYSDRVWLLLYIAISVVTLANVCEKTQRTNAGWVSLCSDDTVKGSVKYREHRIEVFPFGLCFIGRPNRIILLQIELCSTDRPNFSPDMNYFCPDCL